MSNLPKPVSRIRADRTFLPDTLLFTEEQMRDYGQACAAFAQQRIEDLERALGELLPGPYYTDPPDGGSVTLMATSTIEALRFARETLDEARHYCEGPQWSPSMADQCVNAIARIDAALARAIGTREGGDANAAPGRSPESAVATATRPSRGFLKGESPQATWPWDVASKSSEP